MDILTINDVPGVYPTSFYAATADVSHVHAEAEGEISADICVVGGGYTGLSSALHLAQRGYRVVVLEASRIGFGASGRNGGQVGTGQRREQFELEKLVGEQQAHLLWDMGLEAVALVKDLIAQSPMDAEWQPGIIHADHKKSFSAHSAAQVEHLQKKYGYEQISFLNEKQIRSEVGSANYHSGVLDKGGAHIHPLKYVLGLAKMAQDAGVIIHENSRINSVDRQGPHIVVKTEKALVKSDYLVLAMNGHHDNVEDDTAQRVMPINNFIAVTEPLDEAEADALIANDYAIADSRFVVNYFRRSRDHRLIFGGGESYGYRFPADIKSKVRKPLISVFPQLKDVQLEYAWGGTLGITMSRLPHFKRLEPCVYSMSGFSGHGIAMATLSGKLVAEAIAGQNERFDVMMGLPTPRFPGGKRLRTPLLALGMLWYGLRDRM